MARGLGWLPVLAVACSPDMGAPAEWIPIQAIFYGALATDAGDLAVAARARRRPARDHLQRARGRRAAAHFVDDLIARGHDQADVLLVQEIDRVSDQGDSRARQLADALGMGFVYAPALETDAGTRGVAILSHHALVDARVMALPAPGAYPVPTPRNALAAELETSRGPVTVISVHLDTRLSAAERVLQLRPAVLDAPARTIVGGDMNSNPYAWAFDTIPVFPASVAADTDQSEVLDDYVRAVGYDTPTERAGPTQRFGGLSSRLDAIYTRGVTPGGARVDRTVAGSDHWPVILDVTIEAP